MGTTKSPDITSTEHSEPLRPGWIAVTGLIFLSAIVACNKVWTFDAFWHLKSGQWMLEHHQVLKYDPFSTPETPDGSPTRWVNVHWLFQIIVACCHGLGGFAGLVVLKMVCFAATFALFASWFSKRVSPAWLMFTGIWIILSCEGRIRVRPEIFTFAFLMATMVILETVRTDGKTRLLWWLVPINIAWVNMHGLFVVGVITTWSAVIGAFIDRALRRESAGGLATGKAVLIALVATAACFVSPWPVEAALHPLILQTRISGKEAAYTFGVSEFRPTYTINPFKNVSTFSALLMGLAVLDIMQLQWRKVPLGHLLWFGFFATLAMMAIRNVMLFAIPAGFLLTLHGGDGIKQIVQRHRRLGKIGLPATILMIVIIIAIATGYATEASYRWQRRQACRFGFGLARRVHPIKMAKWLGKVNLSGDILPLDFGNGGVFIYYSWPRRKVWMDGRLELHSLKRFLELQKIDRKLFSPIQAADPIETQLPPTVRFIVVSADDTKHIESLNESARFKLVYVDYSAICFARVPMKGETGVEMLRKWNSQEKLPPANLDEYDLPLNPDLSEPLLKDAETTRKWYRQNTPAEHWKMGAILYSLGLDDLAIRYLTVAYHLKLREPISRVGMLAQTHQRLSEYRPIEPVFEPDCDLPVDPNLTRALALYQTMNLSDLRDSQSQVFALTRVRGLIKGRQIDAAVEAMRQYLDNLPIPQRWWPSTSALQVRDSIKSAYHAAQARRDEFNLSGLLPLERALLLLRKDVGLINSAIAELESANSLPARAKLLLGDLYLRKGLAQQARKIYNTLADKTHWALLMRLGLCAWAEGNLSAAEKYLERAVETNSSRPEPLVYLATFYEQLGYYKTAVELISKHTPALDANYDSEPYNLLRQLEARLKIRGYEFQTSLK